VKHLTLALCLISLPAFAEPLKIGDHVETIKDGLYRVEGGVLKSTEGEQTIAGLAASDKWLLDQENAFIGKLAGEGSKLAEQVKLRDDALAAMKAELEKAQAKKCGE
jgi:hypothetical protein